MINKKHVIREVLTFVRLKIAYNVENRKQGRPRSTSYTEFGTELQLLSASAGQWLVKIAYSSIPCL